MVLGLIVPIIVVAVLASSSIIYSIINAAADEALTYTNKTIQAAETVCAAPIMPDGFNPYLSLWDEEKNAMIMLRNTANVIEIIDGETETSKGLKLATHQIEKLDRRVHTYYLMADVWNDYHGIACTTRDNPTEDNRRIFIIQTMALPIKLLANTTPYDQSDGKMIKDLLSALPGESQIEAKTFLERSITYGRSLVSQFDDEEAGKAANDPLNEIGRSLGLVD